MSSIFSTQNLQTSLRRKNLRPPPPSRGGPPGPRPPPPNRGRSPPGLGPSLDRGRSLGAAACSGAFVSSAITRALLRNLCHARNAGRNQGAGPAISLPTIRGLDSDPESLGRLYYAVAGASGAGTAAGVSSGAAAGTAAGAGAGAAGCALTFFFESRSFLILSSRFCS